MAVSLDVSDVAAELYLGIRLLVRRLRQAQSSGELTMPESSALARLDRSGPTTASALARAEQISPQSMGATLASLEERGLIERRPDPGDGRRSVIFVTEEGLAALRSRRDARTEQLARGLASAFSPAEIEQLMAAAPLLERLAQSI